MNVIGRKLKRKQKVIRYLIALGCPWCSCQGTQFYLPGLDQRHSRRIPP
jgi:hypothetical protein